MSGTPAPPDWAALYQKHRDGMYRVAARVLREAGLADQAGDAVQEAVVSLMAAPPTGVRNWEPVMIATAKRRALDRLGSAAVRHAGPQLGVEHDCATDRDVADEVAESVDNRRTGAVVWDMLAELDERHRKVAWEYIALGRPRTDVAAELGMTPARVSQMAKRSLEILRDAIRQEGGDNMIRDERDEALANLLEARASGATTPSLSELTDEDRTEIDSLIEVADLLWEAGHGAAVGV